MTAMNKKVIMYRISEYDKSGSKLIRLIGSPAPYAVHVKPKQALEAINKNFVYKIERAVPTK